MTPPGSTPEAIPEPGVVMAWLEEKAVEIDALGKRLEAAHIELGEAEAAWERELDKQLLAQVDEAERTGGRLPAADVRLARARQGGNFDLWAAYRQARREVDGIEQHSRKLETAISARQSTLKGIQEAESRIPAGVDPRTGEVYGSGGRGTR